MCACAKNEAKNLIYASTKAKDAKKGSDIVGQTLHSTFTALCSSHTLCIYLTLALLCTKIAKLSGYGFRTMQTSAFFFYTCGKQEISFLTDLIVNSPWLQREKRFTKVAHLLVHTTRIFFDAFSTVIY